MEIKTFLPILIGEWGLRVSGFVKIVARHLAPRFLESGFRYYIFNESYTSRVFWAIRSQLNSVFSLICRVS